MEPQAQASQFDMLHGGSRLSVFLYETEHPPEALSTPAYFLPVAGRLRRNDVIVACAGANKAPTWGLFMVRQIRPDGVHLEDLNAFQAERIGAFAMLRRPPGREALRRALASHGPVRLAGTGRGDHRRRRDRCGFLHLVRHHRAR